MGEHVLREQVGVADHQEGPNADTDEDDPYVVDTEDMVDDNKDAEDIEDKADGNLVVEDMHKLDEVVLEAKVLIVEWRPSIVGMEPELEAS